MTQPRHVSQAQELLSQVLLSPQPAASAMGMLRAAPPAEYANDEEILDVMAAWVEGSYWSAFSLGLGTYAHACIEFNGLMSVYVNACRRAHAEGKEWKHANKHSKKGLPLRDVDVIYLAEKFDCIFGETFKANPELWELFKQEMEKNK